MKQIRPILGLILALSLLAACQQSPFLDLDPVQASGSRAVSAVLPSSQGTVTVTEMSNQGITIRYEPQSTVQSARVYVSEGNGLGLVRAAEPMAKSGTAFTYQFSHPTFQAGARIRLVVLSVANGVESAVPQGPLADTAQWASVIYGQGTQNPDPSDPDPTDPGTPGDTSDLTLSGAAGSLRISAMTGNSVTVSYPAPSGAAFVRLFLSEGNGQGLVLASKDMTYLDGAYVASHSHPSFIAGAKIHAAVLVYRQGAETLVPQGQLAQTTTWANFVYGASGTTDPSDPSDPDPEDPTDPSDPEDPSDPTDPTDPGTPGTGTPGLYLDRSLTAATWQELAAGTQAHFAIGDWDSTTNVSLQDGIATMTVTDKAPSMYFSGGTLGQVPAQANGESYYDFSTVDRIRFQIRSSQLQGNQIGFILQDRSGQNIINNVPLSQYGAGNISQWTTVTIPTSQVGTRKVGISLAFLLGTGVGNSIQVKDIGFLTASGANAPVTNTVRWTTYDVAAIKASMNLVWNETFSNPGAPSPASWTYDLDSDNPFGPDNRWGNAEAQIYTNSRDNSWVDTSGNLILAAKYRNGQWTSARLKTKGLKDFRYGYIEVKAKVPVAGGSWPAIWMLPTNPRWTDPRPGAVTYGTVWPASGEIDIMEHATNFPAWGKGNAHGTTHTFTNSGMDHGYMGGPMGGRHFDDIDTAFHTYAILWTPQRIVLFYDDVRMGEYANPYTPEEWMGYPFTENFHLIINLAMGGKLGGRIDSTNDVLFTIDHVKVWQ